MTSPTAELPRSPGGAAAVQAVTVIMGIVVGLTFMFGFGNVLNLALRLGVPAWIAPLVAPAVYLSILGLLLGIRQLALTGATSLDDPRRVRCWPSRTNAPSEACLASLASKDYRYPCHPSEQAS